MDSKLPQAIGVGRITTSHDWRGVKGHCHDFVEMMVLFGGKLAIEIDGQLLHASTGDILFYPPSLPHTECGEGTASLDFAFLAFRDGPVSGPFVTRDSNGRVRILTEWLLEEQKSRYERKQELMNAIMAALLAEFAKAGSDTEEPLTRAVRDFLLLHLGQPVTVTDIAEHVNMSRAHFQRVYRRLTGRTPMAELRRLRVEAARDRLIATNLPLKRIAVQTGFCDEYHMSRVFRDSLCVPPSYFRKH